jgi:hypothetical protein
VADDGLRFDAGALCRTLHDQRDAPVAQRSGAAVPVLVDTPKQRALRDPAGL